MHHIENLFLLNINFDIVYGDNEFKNRIKSKEYVEYNNLNFLELNSEINFTLSEKKIFNINDLRTEELKSLLYGKRILRDEYNVFSNAIRPHIITWTYPRLHDYYWSNSLITDHSSNKLLHIKFLEEKFSW